MSAAKPRGIFGYGMCECGCGQPTTIAKRTDSAAGYTKGEPRRFVQGHSGGRPKRTDFVTEQEQQICSAVDCDEPVSRCGLCIKHYSRLWRNGDPNISKRYGESNPGWAGDGALYRSVHSRLIRTRGKASTYPCVDCGKQAHDWSYDGSDPNEKANHLRLRYSTDPACYVPRCRRCHKLFDNSGRGTDGR